MKYRLLVIFIFFLAQTTQAVMAQADYNLWLNYTPLKTDVKTTNNLRKQLSSVYLNTTIPTLNVAALELKKALHSMLNFHPQFLGINNSMLIAGNINDIGKWKNRLPQDVINSLGNEGYLIKTVLDGAQTKTIITANTNIGVLYGTFHFIKLLQTGKPISALDIQERPGVMYRVLNHWDNANRTVERGYAGSSIWNWHKLPGYIDERYIDYARANASVGINGTVINNVNANTIMLTPAYLNKVKALANVFRPYGIRVYLSVKFSSPVEIGKLKTADPLDTAVQRWWKEKANEIYTLIPDFGGFLVKANSEGQPGPQSYGRSHADGANMLADAVKPHGGIVMWRAFVYDNNVPDDRAKQAYNEFKPLDGKFRSNVIVQVKNGPIDFQPREPFHPLFGAMPNTPLMLELQLTQEYLGFSTHLVYEAPMFKECLEADTYAQGKNTTVSRIIQGKYKSGTITGMAGVANIGTDINWCGHPFAQANWYAFGRLAWNPDEQSAAIADDWLRMTYSTNQQFVLPMKDVMLQSRETTVNYMTPLGLHHIMSADGHYGPGPWVDYLGRADWNSVYYHKADSAGIGFNRTRTGSNALSQYFPEVQSKYENLETCPDSYLLWFHHLKWNYRMRSGKTLWQEMVNHYYSGAHEVKQMQAVWNKMDAYVDKTRHRQVKELLAIQYNEAVWWRDACVLYFQSFSRMPIPDDLPAPAHDLKYYRNLQIPLVPGHGSN